MGSCAYWGLALVFVCGCGGKNVSFDSDAQAGADAAGTSPGMDASSVDAGLDGPDASSADAANNRADAMPDSQAIAQDASSAAIDSASDSQAVAQDASSTAIDAAPDSTADAATDGEFESSLDSGVDSMALDSSADSDSSADDLDAFCTGDAVRSMLDGVDAGMTMSGHQIVMDCCNGGEFEGLSPKYQAPVYVTCSEQVGSGSIWPETVDLANLPSRWSFHVDVSCDPLGSACTSAYTSDRRGWLQVANAGTGIDMSLCLTVHQTPGGSGEFGSIQMYAPHVITH